MKKIFRCLQYLCIFGVILLYELSNFFTENGMDIFNIGKNVLILVLLFSLFVKNIQRPLSMPSYLKWFFGIFCCLLLVEFVGGLAANIVKPITSMLILFVVAKYGDRDFVAKFFRCLLVVALMSTIELVVYYILTGMYMRSEIMFDKGMQTFLFGFALTYLAIGLIHGMVRRKILAVALFLYFLFVDIFILQSKTSILALLMSLFVYAVFYRRKVWRFFKNNWKFVVIVFVGCSVIFVQFGMPDAFKEAVNRVLGTKVYKVEYENDLTYKIREDIREKTYSILEDDPFTGVGFGNVPNVSTIKRLGLDQAESELFDILLEGGITYMLAFIILIGGIVLKSLKNAKKKRNAIVKYNNILVASLLVGFLALCFGDEMLSSVAWMYIGCLISIVHSKRVVNMRLI